MSAFESYLPIAIGLFGAAHFVYGMKTEKVWSGFFTSYKKSEHPARYAFYMLTTAAASMMLVVLGVYELFAGDSR